jgi:uncharacterized protein
MKCQLITQPMPYTGDALANHWIYRNFGTLGDAVVAFIGPCEVTPDRMVDLEDVLNNDSIYSRQMLHFIIELFEPSLREGVLIQRLFSSILQQKLNDLMGDSAIERRGDDLFYQNTKKLSVSICTVSPTSILIHAGLNVESGGAPVEAAGLTNDLGLEQSDIEQFALNCMHALADEWKDIRMACCKVRAVN